MGASDISGDIGEDGKTSRGSTTEPVRSKSLVAEDRTKTVRAQLGGSSIGEELKDESNFGEGGEHTGNVEFEVLVFLLILDESIVFEFLEDLVVDDGVFAIGTIVTILADVVEEGVEEVVLEVDAVADVNITTGRRDVSFEATVLGDTTGGGSIDQSRKSRDLGRLVADGEHTDEWVSTGELPEH